MTSIFSSNAFKYFRYRLFSRKAPLILLLILNVLSYPLLFGTMLAGTGLKPFYDMIASSFVICIVSLAVIFFIGFYIAISSFNYLHDRSIVDMNMALPLTSGQRFCADYLAGLAMYTVPYIASSAIGLTLYSIAAKIGFYNIFGVDSFRVDYIFKSVPPIEVAQYMLGGLIAMIMLYSLVVLVTSFCGSVVEATIYSLVINLMLPIGAFTTAFMIYWATFGIDYSEGILQIIGASSPIGALIGVTAQYNIILGYAGMMGDNILCVPVVMCNIVFIALCVVGSFFAVKHRKAEQVGKPFVYRATYNSIIAIILYGIVSAFAPQIYNRFISTSNSFRSDGVTLFVTMIIVTFIVFIIFDSITGRGFKRFGCGLLRYALTFLGCIAVSALLIAADGFGMSRYMPEIDGVESVTVGVESYNYPFVEEMRNMELIFTEKESIEKVQQIHKEAISRYTQKLDGVGGAASVSFSYTTTRDVTITYKMKSGELVKRWYSIPTEFIAELKAMPVSEETRLARFNVISDIMMEETDKYLENGFHITDTLAYSEANAKVSREQFLEALKKDMLAETDEQFMGSFLPVGSVDIYTYTHDIMYCTNTMLIKPSYHNVISLLSENGAGDILTNDYTENIGDNVDTSIFIYKTDSEEYADYCSHTGRYVSPDQSEQLNEFIKKCKVSFAYEDYFCVPNRYFAWVIGEYGVRYLTVPTELYAEAERLIESSSNMTGGVPYTEMKRKLFDIAGIDYTITQESYSDRYVDYIYFDYESLSAYEEHAKNILVESGYVPETYEDAIVCAFDEEKRNVYIVDSNDNIVVVDTYENVTYAEDAEVA